MAILKSFLAVAYNTEFPMKWWTKLQFHDRHPPLKCLLASKQCAAYPMQRNDISPFSFKH